MDTMAINGAKVPEMQAAIESYIIEVEEGLNNISHYEMGASEGIYGAAQITTVNSYIDETCKQINSIVRYFEDFKTVLDQVREAYEQQQAAITTGEVEQAKENDGDLVTVNRMS